MKLDGGELKRATGPHKSFLCQNKAMSTLNTRRSVSVVPVYFMYFVCLLWVLCFVAVVLGLPIWFMEMKLLAFSLCNSTLFVRAPITWHVVICL